MKGVRCWLLFVCLFVFFIFTVVLTLDLWLEYKFVTSFVKGIRGSSGEWQIPDLFHSFIIVLHSTYEYRLSACCLFVLIPIPVIKNHWWDARLTLISIITVNASASQTRPIRWEGDEVRGPGVGVPLLRGEIISHRLLCWLGCGLTAITGLSLHVQDERSAVLNVL